MKIAPGEACFVGGNIVMKKEESNYTIADIEALPEGKRAELIDGKMYMMASPSFTHQRILAFLGNKFYNYIEEKQGKCVVIPAPFALYLDEKNNYVEPDLVVICDQNKIDEKGCHGGPDLVIEIVSSSSMKMDYMLKLFKYRICGVQEYLIVDPDKNRVQVYGLTRDDMREYTFTDQIPVGIYDGDLMIDLSKFPRMQSAADE